MSYFIPAPELGYGYSMPFFENFIWEDSLEKVKGVIVRITFSKTVRPFLSNFLDSIGVDFI